MTPKITTLIPQHTSLVVRDQIAAILKVESEKQQEIAAATPGANPLDYRLRVFTEAAGPWELFPREDLETKPPEAFLPIVNVSVASGTFDDGSSDVVEQQKIEGLFNIDCFGMGVTRAGVATLQELGDKVAATQAQRAFGLAYNILMAGHYVTLGLTKTVWRRFPKSYEMSELPDEERASPYVRIVRFVLGVEFSTKSPQWVGETLELIHVAFKRSPTGEWFSADIPIPAPVP